MQRRFLPCNINKQAAAFRVSVLSSVTCRRNSKDSNCILQLYCSLWRCTAVRRRRRQDGFACPCCAGRLERTVLGTVYGLRLRWSHRCHRASSCHYCTSHGSLCESFTHLQMVELLCRMCACQKTSPCTPMSVSKSFFAAGSLSGWC